MYTVIKSVIPNKRVPCESKDIYSVDGGKTWLSSGQFSCWKRRLVKIVPLHEAHLHVEDVEDVEDVEAPLTLWQFLKLLFTK